MRELGVTGRAYFKRFSVVDHDLRLVFATTGAADIVTTASKGLPAVTVSGA